LEENKSVRDTGLVVSVFLLGICDYSEVSFFLGEVDVSEVFEDVSCMNSSWEQVKPHKESVKRLFDDQLGTWWLAVLETIAFVLACVDVFGYGSATLFMGSHRMLVVALVFLLHQLRIVAWLLQVR